jgi:hypothetical protein
VERNQATCELRIIAELSRVDDAIKTQNLISRSPDILRLVVTLQEHVINLCVGCINDETYEALEDCKRRWESSTVEIKTNEPFGFLKFRRSMGQLNRYIQCIE